MHNIDNHTGPSFSFKNRMGRLIWNVISAIFFRFSPNFLHGFRRFLLRSFGAQVGKGVHVYPRVKIWAPWNVVLLDECGIANGAILYSQGKITVGQRAVVSQGVHLCAGTHDYNDPGFRLITMPIVIGDQAWVAAEAFIHPGVEIGQGCVIGARSVVTKSMPAWMICAGHPCKPLKERELINNVQIGANKGSTFKPLKEFSPESK